MLFIGGDPIEEAISTCGTPWSPCKDNATACPVDTCLLSGRQFRYYDDDNLGLYNGIHYQNTGSNTSRSVLCQHLALDALPTSYQWNNFSGIDGGLIDLRLENQGLTEIPAHGFDNCPYTNALLLDLQNNSITTVGTQAFAKLTGLEAIYIAHNLITWMAYGAFDGLPNLDVLSVGHNLFDYLHFGGLYAQEMVVSVGLDLMCPDSVSPIITTTI